jgi:transposase-like protein
MKNPVYEQIQARKVKARLRMLQHAQRISGSVSQTCRFFGVSRAFYYIWKKRYEKNGVAGLRDLPRRPHNIRFRIPPEIVSLILRILRESLRNCSQAVHTLTNRGNARCVATTILRPTDCDIHRLP